MLVKLIAVLFFVQFKEFDYFCHELRMAHKKQSMTKQSILILLLSIVFMGMMTGCKEEKKSNDIITKIAPKPKIPKGPQKMSDFKYEKKVDWLGSSYTLRIRRYADKDLAMIKDDEGKQYLDNRIQVEILRKDGTSFFDRTFVKNDFTAFTGDDYNSHSALLGFMYDRTEGNFIHFGASVGSPDPNSDDFIPLDVSVDNMGRVHITNALDLDGGSDDEGAKQGKSQVDMAEDEGV